MGAGRGFLVSVEGVDAAGKTTQVSALQATLAALGLEVVAAPPDGTVLGVELQAALVARSGGIPLEPWVEALLFTAGRAQLVRERIRPALERGAVVVADRYVDSTLAYQGGGRGLSLDSLRRLHDDACGALWPDLTLLLGLGPRAAAARRASLERRLDRFEEAPADFHRRVGECFDALAAAEPARFVRLDAGRPIGDVAARIGQVVLSRLPPAMRPPGASALRDDAVASRGN